MGVVSPQHAAAGEQRTGRSVVQIVKDIVLFFAAPFITMAYLAAFPFIGLKLLRQTWHHRLDAG